MIDDSSLTQCFETLVFVHVLVPCDLKRFSRLEEALLALPIYLGVTPVFSLVLNELLLYGNYHVLMTGHLRFFDFLFCVDWSCFYVA